MPVFIEITDFLSPALDVYARRTENQLINRADPDNAMFIAESPLVIVYGHHMSDGTMFAPLAQYSSRDFAEGHRTIRIYTREKAIELKVFAADVVDASSEGKRTDFADAAELAAYLGDKLSRCEVVLEEPADIAQAWAFVTCSYQTSNSRTVVYAKEVEGWDSRPSE